MNYLKKLIIPLSYLVIALIVLALLFVFAWLASMLVNTAITISNV